MSKPRKSQRLSDLHSLALRRFSDISLAQMPERAQALEDRRFYSIAGAQWEGALAAQFANRPQLEINKTHLSVMRIINEWRNNRISVDFLSKDGLDLDELADTCDSLYRADEQDSGAQEAYDNAFEEAVAGGMGAWRVTECYEDEYDEDNTHQRIRFEPIFDADTSVYFDLQSKRQDKSDAEYCFVISSMTVEAYKQKYDDDPITWPKVIYRYSGNWSWYIGNMVYVAEYYLKETQRQTFYTFTDITLDDEKISEADLMAEVEPVMIDGYQDDDATIAAAIAARAALGTKLVTTKKVKRDRVRKYILSGGGVLEDCSYIAGCEIPIVVTFGKRWFIDNIERFAGHIRYAKDSQRLLNMQVSRLAEINSKSTVSKPIMTAEQVLGLEQFWKNDNIEDYAFLPINPVKGPNGEMQHMGPVGATQPPEVPPAMAALMQISDASLDQLLGNQQAAEEVTPDTSGVALERAQMHIDMQAYIFISNMAKAVQMCGKIWIGKARELYVEQGRRMKAIGPRAETSSVMLARPVQDAETGAVTYENDMSRAKYDIVVDIGPSSSTRRMATVRALTSMMQMAQDPDTIKVLTASALMQMEGEGLHDLNAYYRKQLIQLGVVKPTEEEQAEMDAAAQAAQPNPQEQFLLSSAKKQEASAVADLAHAKLYQAQSAKALHDATEPHRPPAQPQNGRASGALN